MAILCQHRSVLGNNGSRNQNGCNLLTSGLKRLTVEKLALSKFMFDFSIVEFVLPALCIELNKLVSRALFLVHKICPESYLLMPMPTTANRGADFSHRGFPLDFVTTAGPNADFYEPTAILKFLDSLDDKVCPSSDEKLTSFRVFQDMFDKCWTTIESIGK